MLQMSKDEKVMNTTNFTNDFSKEIYEQTYRLNNETIDTTLERIALGLSEVEVEKDYWYEKFLYALQDFKVVPGGRIISNIGSKLKGTTAINCFVSGFSGEDQDSMEGIFAELRRQGLILKSEGGYGFNIDVLRPRYSYIEGIGNESPGAVAMLEMWDTQSRVITQGSGKVSDKKNAKSKIRKGAQLVCMSCFSSTTEILTNIGWINIVELILKIDKGEEIYATKKAGEYKEIYNPIIREPEEIFEVETDDGSIVQVTADHQFEVRNIETGKIYLKKINDINSETEEMCIICEDGEE